MQWKLAKPYRGAVIRVKVRFYYHYGIYIDDDTVVQFGLPDCSGMKPEDIEVLTTDISVFLGGGFLEVGSYSAKEKLKKRSNSGIAGYALSKLGTKGYHILHNNCEHFVNECAFGKRESSFIDDARNRIKTALSADNKGNKDNPDREE